MSRCRTWQFSVHWHFFTKLRPLYLRKKCTSLILHSKSDRENWNNHFLSLLHMMPRSECWETSCIQLLMLWGTWCEGLCQKEIVSRLYSTLMRYDGLHNVSRNGLHLFVVMRCKLYGGGWRNYNALVFYPLENWDQESWMLKLKFAFLDTILIYSNKAFGIRRLAREMLRAQILTSNTFCNSMRRRPLCRCIGHALVILLINRSVFLSKQLENPQIQFAKV